MKFLSFTKINLIVLFILIALVLLLPDLLFAEEAGNTKIGGGAWYESILWTLVNGFFGLLVWMGGTLLNISVSQFVVGFGELFRTQGLGFAVDHLWTLVRDIFNLTFIFGLVYIGFKMILRSDDSGAKKTLVSIILAALLVNFSLFFAKAIVDFSNIAATQIAQGFPSSTPGEYDVSSKFMQTLGLSSIWGTDGKFLENVATGQGNGIGYIFGTMVIFIITAFVFFAGAILLLIRFVVLNLYLIMSPIMFLGWVFPNLSGASKKYWNDFLNRAFFAPAYLLILYFAFYILQEFNTKTAGKESYAMIFSGENPGGNMNILPYFVITCIFLLAAVVVAQKMSVEGANWAISFSKNMTGRLAFGLPALVAQKTVGAGFNRAANSEFLRRNSNSVGGRTAIRLSRNIADRSFDARHALNKIPKNSHFDFSFGEGGKAGHVTALKEREKWDKTFAESLERKTRDSNGNHTESVLNAFKNDNNLKEIEKSVDDIKTKKENLEKEVTEKKDLLTKKNQALKSELKDLTGKLANAKSEIEKTKINNNINAVKSNIEENRKDSEYEVSKLRDEITSLNKAIDENDKKITNRKLEVEARERYADVIKFQKSREKDAELYNKVGGSVARGVVGGSAVAGGLILGGLGIAPALAIAAAGVGTITTMAETNKRSANSLLAIYGTDYVKKMKAEKKKGDLKILAEAQKEAGIVPETENKA